MKGIAKELNCDLKAASKKMWLYVGKLKPDTTQEDLTSYLKKKIPNRTFEVEALRMDKYSSSFRVAADYDLLEQLYSEQFWPSGILVKRFIFFRKRQSQPQQQSFSS